MKNEKVSVNINEDRLAAIDLLVEEGLISNRSAFINEAVDLLLQKKQNIIDGILKNKQESLSPDQWFIGLQSIDRDYLMQFKDRGIKLSLRGFGSLYMNKEIDAELILETVAYVAKPIRVHGTNEQLNAIKEINNKDIK